MSSEFPNVIVVPWAPSEYTSACLRELDKTLNCPHFDHDKDPAEQLRDVEMVVDLGGRSPRHYIDTAVNTKFWQVIGTGLDHCDVPYILSKGIQLANTPGFTSAYGLSECAMMFILMLTRKYHQAKDNFNSKVFYEPLGSTLDGMSLGMIGYGASARQLAKRAKSFGMRIEAIDVRPLETDVADDVRPDFYGMADQTDEVIARCDFLSLHLHLTPETRHIIDARRLSLMKPTSFVINVARGALIDEDALAAAVLEGKIAGAGIDVFDEEPADHDRPEYQLPNFITTPHSSGQTDETVRRRCGIVVENAKRMAAGQELLHLIDANMGLGKS